MEKYNALRRHKQAKTEGYTPAALLSALYGALDVKNDAQLCRALGMMPPQISRFRNGVKPLSPGMIVRIADVTEWSVAKIRKLCGMPYTNELIG